MAIDIYCDCADLLQMRELRKNPIIRGWTTNPTLIRAAGITDYESFCKEALDIADGLPISFEVFSDEWDEMERQARKIASWGGNVNVKIPVSNTKGESAAPLVRKLSDSGILCNVTAIFTAAQVSDILEKINKNDSIILSIFCGRIADTSVVPRKPFCDSENRKVKYLWASSREVLNITHAEQQDFHIITVTPDLLKKYEQLKGKDLTEFSLQTVRMFYEDAKKSNYQL